MELSSGPDPKTYYPPPAQVRYQYQIGEAFKWGTVHAHGSHRTRRLIRRYLAISSIVPAIVLGLFFLAGALLGFR